MPTPVTPPAGLASIKPQPRGLTVEDKAELPPIITLPVNKPEEPEQQDAPTRIPPLGGKAKRRSRKRRYSTRFLILVAGGMLVTGFVLGRRPGVVVPAPGSAPAISPAPTAAEQAELNAAFSELKSAHYVKAHEMFAVLVQKHPGWTTLNTEVALTSLLGHDALGFKLFIQQGERNGTISPAVRGVLLSQLSMATGEYEDANNYLAQSAGVDPTKPETYYAWGECLLRWGKPKEAAEKFRAARLCNLYPAADSIYTTKLWLAEVASGLETTDGSGKEIDQALAADRPVSAALYAEAARAIKTGNLTQAADDLVKARQVSDPTMFNLVLQDPYFYAERRRPEFAAIYKE